MIDYIGFRLNGVARGGYYASSDGAVVVYRYGIYSRGSFINNRVGFRI